MSTTTVLWLQSRLLKAESRWDKAMARPGYRDDPDEADALKDPFTEQDWALYGWADAWRLQTHAIENELDRLPEAAMARALAFSFSVEEPTFYEAALSTEQLALHTKPLRAADPSNSKSRKAKTR